MDVVGSKFQCGEMFVPEMLTRARAMKAGTELLEPVLLAAGVKPEHRAIVGTVVGDLHDIGKNLVGMMWKGGGLEVIDLGVNVAGRAVRRGRHRARRRTSSASAPCSPRPCPTCAAWWRRPGREPPGQGRRGRRPRHRRVRRADRRRRLRPRRGCRGRPGTRPPRRLSRGGTMFATLLGGLPRPDGTSRARRSRRSSARRRRRASSRSPTAGSVRSGRSHRSNGGASRRG